MYSTKEYCRLHPDVVRALGRRHLVVFGDWQAFRFFRNFVMLGRN